MLIEKDVWSLGWRREGYMKKKGQERGEERELRVVDIESEEEEGEEDG